MVTVTGDKEGLVELGTPSELADAALALVASFCDISAARIRHGLACRHFAMTGDERRMGVALATPNSA